MQARAMLASPFTRDHHWATTLSTSPIPITIATRESRLASWQAEHVKALLQARGHRVTLLGMTTLGDQILDRTLSKVGGKGLFVKELEVALEEGRAHIAVHSLKDVPMDLPEGFALACGMEREDPRDAFVSPRYASLDALPQGAVVGTSSLRRQVLLQALRPDLKIIPLRGNLDTRLRKLDEGQYDAIVLGSAGLLRLGLGERIRARRQRLGGHSHLAIAQGPGAAGQPIPLCELLRRQEIGFARRRRRDFPFHDLDDAAATSARAPAQIGQTYAQQPGAVQ